MDVGLSEDGDGGADLSLDRRSILFSVSPFSAIQLVQYVCFAVCAVTLTRIPTWPAARPSAALIVFALIRAAGSGDRPKPRPEQSERIGQSARGLLDALVCRM